MVARFFFEYTWCLLKFFSYVGIFPFRKVDDENLVKSSLVPKSFWYVVPMYLSVYITSVSLTCVCIYWSLNTLNATYWEYLQGISLMSDSATDRVTMFIIMVTLQLINWIVMYKNIKLTKQFPEFLEFFDINMRGNDIFKQKIMKKVLLFFVW
jgi:hypothetical protein